MIKFICDWCSRGFPADKISRVRVRNLYNEPVTLHICASCGREHMPRRVQAMLSWTAVTEAVDG